VIKKEAAGNRLDRRNSGNLSQMSKLEFDSANFQIKVSRFCQGIAGRLSLKGGWWQVGNGITYHGDDVSRATEGITNATMVSKATMLSKTIVVAMWSEVTVATM
jgi:hypothetical protein